MEGDFFFLKKKKKKKKKKKITALERRYAYNLFPDLKGDNPVPAAASARVVGDDLFGSGSLPGFSFLFEIIDAQPFCCFLF